MFQVAQWFQVKHYSVCVHQVHEEYIAEPGETYKKPTIHLPPGVRLSAPDEPATVGDRYIYLDVAYQNATRTKTLSCRTNQWRLFDSDGYVHEPCFPYNFLFPDRDKVALQEVTLNPGMKLRGWLAFKVPRTAGVELIQFMDDCLSRRTAELAIGPLVRWQPTHQVPAGGMPAWSRPDPSSTQFQLDEGIAVRVLSRAGAWAQLEHPDGWICWGDSRLLAQLNG